MTAGECRMTPAEYEQAACRGQTALMYAKAGPGSDSKQRQAALENEAKAVCARCPVIEACRTCNAHERQGVWFGTTANERGFNGQQQRREPGPCPVPTDAERIRAMVQTTGGRRFTTDDLNEWMHGLVTTDSVSNELRRLLQAGQIMVVGQGRGSSLAYRRVMDHGTSA